MTLAPGGSETFDTAGYCVTLSSSLSGQGRLTLDDSLGMGRLILSGSDTYTGGTAVDAGTLYVTSSDALPKATSLTIGAGGTFVFDPSAASGPTVDSAAFAASPPAGVGAVPEPGTLALLAVGALAAGLGVAWEKKS
jgi:autotransporter-associated beta strand protein